MVSVPQGSVLKRNSRLQVEKGSSADERTDPIGIAIIQTLTYSDHFGFPLTKKEIHLRLINSNQLAKDRSELPQEFRSLSGLQQALKSLLKQKEIQESGGYYYLPGHHSLVARRLKHAKLSLPQLDHARVVAGKLARIPGVLAIYLTGSLAVLNSGNDSDIDLMIITENNRLWTTRFLLTIYTELLGLRRRPNSSHSPGKLCLNLYLTPNTYNLPLSKRSLYTAYELIQAVPLYDPTNTHAALLSNNSWIHKYLPNATRTVPKRNSWLQAEKSPVATGRRVLMSTIEFLLYNLQLLYMRPKLTREYITRNSAFFHPNNPGVSVLRGLSSMELDV